MSAPSSHHDDMLIPAFRNGFPPGYTPVTKEGEVEFDMGVDFGIHRQARGSTLEERHPRESAWVLLDGKAELEFAGKIELVERGSLFDEGPTALHLGPDTPVRISAVSDVEWAVVQAENHASPDPRLFRPERIDAELHGKGLAQGTCLRIARRVFDRESRPEAGIAIGETIGFPGRWSGYPPHHHEQPQICHYRFTLPHGYGHGECGDQVFKLHSYDSMKIPGGVDHAQVAAPGYGMYCLWIIRHLPGKPYTGFTFAKDHDWVLDPNNQGWRPKR
ncbi:MAG: 5-deoxy-glucuronate isomerase [Elusimicrobiota bacterium]